MQLSDQLIFEYLSKKRPFQRRGPRNGLEGLRRPILFFPGMQPEDGRCYVARGGDLAETAFAPAHCCFILTGAPAAGSAAGAALLWTPETIEPGLLLNEVQEIFDRFGDWEDRLHRCIESGSGLQSLLELSQPLFGENYLVVLNRNYRVLASTSGRENKTELMPAEVLSGLKRDPAFVKLMASGKSTFLYIGKYIDHNILFSKISVRKELWAILTLSETNAPITPGQQLLVRHLAKAILDYYRQYVHFFVQGDLVAQSVLSRLIDGECEAEDVFQNLMKGLDWDPEAEFKVCYIPISEADKRIGSVQYVCHQIELLLQYVVAFEYSTDIVVLINHTKMSAAAAESTAQFDLFLRNSSLKAGLSRPFSGLSQLREYYAQAVAALRFGAKVPGDGVIFQFEGVVLDYILDILSSRLSPESICDRGLLALRELDRSRGTSYLRTLSVYYDTGMNATHSAKALFINRSTFLERMTRIRKYVDTDIDATPGRLYLMLCLKLLGY